MSEYGVTLRGFRPKPFEVIQAEIQESFKTQISPNLSFAPNTIAGQLTGIFAAKIGELWELAAGVYTSLDADCAEGRALTALSSLTGTIRGLRESDLDLRKRRLRELRAPGLSTLEALRSKLLVLPGVRGVSIFNDDEKHCFEVIVLGGADIMINRVIAQNKPLGIAGILKRPEIVLLTLEIDLVTNTDLLPDEIATLKNSLVEYAHEHIKLGESVMVTRFYGPLFHNPKVIDVTIAPFNRVIKPCEWLELEAANIQIKKVVDSR
ncbi:MAG: hypothetical protein WCK49_09615 [Myxococcaceae bacterium]